MAIDGLRHLIECHCILPQFRNRKEPVYHKFVVFSITNDDVFQQKLVQCNNCGIVHKVIDFCKSEIVHGIEENKSLRTIEDIKLGIPKTICEFLTQQNADLSIWEFVEFVLENNLEKDVVIKKDDSGGITQVKILQIKQDGTFKVRNHTRQDIVEIQ